MVTVFSLTSSYIISIVHFFYQRMFYCISWIQCCLRAMTHQTDLFSFSFYSWLLVPSFLWLLVSSLFYFQCFTNKSWDIILRCYYFAPKVFINFMGKNLHYWLALYNLIFMKRRYIVVGILMLGHTSREGF